MDFDRQAARDAAADSIATKWDVSIPRQRGRHGFPIAPDVVHGRISTYIKGCRCEPCRARKAVDNRKQTLRRQQLKATR